jgi:hypothetical protein
MIASSYFFETNLLQDIANREVWEIWHEALFDTKNKSKIYRISGVNTSLHGASPSPES